MGSDVPARAPQHATIPCLNAGLENSVQACNFGAKNATLPSLPSFESRPIQDAERTRGKDHVNERVGCEREGMRGKGREKGGGGGKEGVGRKRGFCGFL